MIHRVVVGPIGENTYIVEVGPGRCVVVDPGADPETILAELGRLKLVPSLFALTHGHLDHTAALPALTAEFSKRGVDVQVAIHIDDAAYLGAAAEAANRRTFEEIRAVQYFRHFWTPLPEPDILLRGGDMLPGTDIAVLHTPGHTRGSVCFYLADSGNLLSGDTLFECGVGRTDTSDANAATLRASIHNTLFALPDSVRVWPGHGGSTTIGAERQRI